MAHTLNTEAPELVRDRPLWRRILPVPVRSLGRPLVRAWQRYYDTSRGKRRIREIVRQGEERTRLDEQERIRLLRDATPIFQDVNGFRFVLYAYDAPNLLTLARHPADETEFAVIPRLVRAGDTALDVGANIGLYSALLSRLCGVSGRVWAFEPVPDTYWRLRETLALNRCGNVVPVQSAVCDRAGTVFVNLFGPEHSEWNTLGRPSLTEANGSPVVPERSVQVPACTLDGFCASGNIERVNFLKIDVEGFEVPVFKGAERLLSERRVDYICFEISRSPLKGAGFESRQVFEALERHGYRSYSVEETSGRFEGPVEDTTEEWKNFFASPKDLRSL